MEPAFKGAVLGTLQTLAYLNENYPNPNNYRLLKERLSVEHAGFYFSINNFLCEPLMEKMPFLKAGGLTKYWVENWVHNRFIHVKSNLKGPEVLTMDQLMIGFQLCFICMMISVVAFAIEVLPSLRIRLTMRQILRFMVSHRHLL